METFPELTYETFASGSFQTQLENALADQYPGSETIKNTVIKAQNVLTSLESGIIHGMTGQRENAYVEVAPGYYHFDGDEHRIVEKTKSEEDVEIGLLSAAEVFNAVSGVPRYVYFIQNSRATDFTLREENDRIWNSIREKFQADGFERFVTADYASFCEMFYETDHHWNAAGSDRGYREVLALVSEGTEEPLLHGEPITYDVIFNGSYARQTHDLCSDEKFTVYTYDLPAMKIMLNGKKGQYGHRSLYEKQKYPTDELRNHYAYYYGGDYGEIRVENNNGNGHRLLMVADSYSNPINMLLASHFTMTCVVDPRYFSSDMGRDFDIQDYILENEIDTMLWLGDIEFFMGSGEREATN